MAPFKTLKNDLQVIKYISKKQKKKTHKKLYQKEKAILKKQQKGATHLKALHPMVVKHTAGVTRVIEEGEVEGIRQVNSHREDHRDIKALNYEEP